MIKNTPPFSITNDMLMDISCICESIGKITATSNLKVKPHLRKNSRIESIHSSLKIETNSLSLGQVKDVINGKVVLGDRREIQEVKNAYKAYSMIEDIDVYSIKELKRIHGVMTEKLIDESGKFRSGQEGVFNGDKCIFIAPPSKLVDKLMDDLFSWMKSNKDKIHPLILASVFHYEFVFIHPFADGNGRMARLWHSIILSRWNKIFEYIPLENQIEKFQQDYYNIISICHTEGNSTKFIEFMLSQTKEILNELADSLSSNGMLPVILKNLLNVMDYQTYYSANELMLKLNLKSRDGFRKNYLKPALDLGLIKRSIPDKPNSRNQRYIKV